MTKINRIDVREGQGRKDDQTDPRHVTDYHEYIL